MEFVSSKSTTTDVYTHGILRCDHTKRVYLGKQETNSVQISLLNPPYGNTAQRYIIKHKTTIGDEVIYSETHSWSVPEDVKFDEIIISDIRDLFHYDVYGKLTALNGGELYIRNTPLRSDVQPTHVLDKFVTIIDNSDLFDVEIISYDDGHYAVVSITLRKTDDIHLVEYIHEKINTQKESPLAMSHCVSALLGGRIEHYIKQLNGYDDVF